jgi:hypothetical protein
MSTHHTFHQKYSPAKIRLQFSYFACLAYPAFSSASSSNDTKSSCFHDCCCKSQYRGSLDQKPLQKGYDAETYCPSSHGAMYIRYTGYFTAPTGMVRHLQLRSVDSEFHFFVVFFLHFSLYTWYLSPVFFLLLAEPIRPIFYSTADPFLISGFQGSGRGLCQNISAQILSQNADLYHSWWSGPCHTECARTSLCNLFMKVIFLGKQGGWSEYTDRGTEVLCKQRNSVACWNCCSFAWGVE